jgi:hypothetical protein
MARRATADQAALAVNRRERVEPRAVVSGRRSLVVGVGRQYDERRGQRWDEHLGVSALGPAMPVVLVRDRRGGSP